MREAGGTSRVLPIDDDDPRTPSRIATAVAAGGDRRRADHQLARRPAPPAEGAARATRSVKIGTFDLGPDVLKAVEAGRIGFAVDQQPYLQGYLPIEMLALRARYGHPPGAGRRRRDRARTSSRASNAAQALELSERSIR